MNDFPSIPLRLLALVTILFGSLTPALTAQDPDVVRSAHQVFDQPVVYHQLRDVMPRGLRLGRMGNVEQMADIMKSLVEATPDHPVFFYNLACAQARLGRRDEALDALEQAVRLGLTNFEQFVEDPDLASIQDLPRFAEIQKLAETTEPFAVNLPPPVPLSPVDGVVRVQASNTGWDPRLAQLVTLFAFADEAPVGIEAVTGRGAARDHVREWYREGSAAGNHGDLYDNRDDNHSTLQYKNFPMLTRVEYDSEARKRKLHWGPQTRFIYNAVTIGNASVAATGTQHWGSMARHVYVNARTMDTLHTQYRSSQLYVYPEHRDHDIGHNGSGGGYGDVFCINTPYLVISQGSSGSDKVFLDALALSLAALRPEVKARLREHGLLVPTLQMILRRCGKQVISTHDYLSGRAHPTVFDGKMLQPERMVKLAHAILPDALPPLALLQVVEEDTARPGIDFFHNSPSEVICTTPGTIGRVARSMAYTRRMVVSAAESMDADRRPLTYHWRVLRGDADRIRITPQNESGSVVELIIPYHERFPVADGALLKSNRIDIGAFVHNGAHYSAPAFVSVFYLDNEQREYDKANRIRSVQYRGAATPGNYVDPRIDTPKDWRDEYHYRDGVLTGWTRTMPEGNRHEFTPTGRLIVERDADGNPTDTRVAVYPAVVGGDGRSVLAQAALETPQPVGPRRTP